MLTTLYSEPVEFLIDSCREATTWKGVLENNYFYNYFRIFQKPMVKFFSNERGLLTYWVRTPPKIVVMLWFIETFFLDFKNFYFPELIWMAPFVTVESTKVNITLGFKGIFFNSRNLKLWVIFYSLLIFWILWFAWVWIPFHTFFMKYFVYWGLLFRWIFLDYFKHSVSRWHSEILLEIFWIYV